MLRRLLAELRLWEEAIAGLDDPIGDYLLELENRVARLERDLIEVRKLLPEQGAVGAASNTNSAA
ncbi:hypothetical protein [Roseibium sp. M-1]